ncbi:MAG: carbohydrate kinase family protein [Planctomycetota bacterium]
MPSAAQCVVTVGGATAERVLVVDPGQYRPGGKHTLKPQRTMAGGSAINQACRLLATGTPVDPVVPMSDDQSGAVVLQTLRDAALRGRASAPWDDVFVPGNGLTTPFTTITSIGVERTIYTEFSDALFDPFEAHLRARAASWDPSRVGAVLVGHVHADRAALPGRGGALTKEIVRAAGAAGIPVFVNPGSSQYRLGVEAFADELGDLACLQLDLDEMRQFVGEPGSVPLPLAAMLAWFRERCTVIVTMERMGAVGQRKGSSQIVLTWPYEIDVVDTTGAGDAFAAGVVEALMRRPLDDDAALAAAMDRGGLFAAHACLTPGGADQCPTAAELEAFRGRRQRMLDTEVTTIDQASRVLRMLDQVFPAR